VQELDLSRSIARAPWRLSYLARGLPLRLQEPPLRLQEPPLRLQEPPLRLQEPPLRIDPTLDWYVNNPNAYCISTL